MVGWYINHKQKLPIVNIHREAVVIKQKSIMKLNLCKEFVNTMILITQQLSNLAILEKFPNLNAIVLIKYRYIGSFELSLFFEQIIACRE